MVGVCGSPNWAGRSDNEEVAPIWASAGGVRNVSSEGDSLKTDGSRVRACSPVSRRANTAPAPPGVRSRNKVVRVRSHRYAARSVDRRTIWKQHDKPQYIRMNSKDNTTSPKRAAAVRIIHNSTSCGTAWNNHNRIVVAFPR